MTDKTRQNGSATEPRITSPAEVEALRQGFPPEFGSPTEIRQQEAAGQRSLLGRPKSGRSRLPTKSNLPQSVVEERFGVVFHDAIDNLFTSVTLPDGWRIRETEHAMWTEVVDQKGEVKAEIFYKAAIYDQRADITWKESRPGAENTAL